MRVWGKTSEERRHTIGVSRVALASRSPGDLLRATVETLLASGHADRFGVWVESAADSSEDGRTNCFRGIVADREIESIPAEWSRLSPELPLPQELLVGLRSVEQEIMKPDPGVIIAALISMRRVLWVPLVVHGHLGGVLFAGDRKKGAYLPRALLESVAAELTLALELEEQRHLGRQSQLDSTCVRSILAALGGPTPMGDILVSILQDCTRHPANGSEPAAIFAAIGRPFDPQNINRPSLPIDQTMCFAWVSGDPAWAPALESKPLSAVWRQALASGRVAGIQPGVTAGATILDEKVARLIAFPLLADGEALGVLVAGIRNSNSSVATLEHLELRAALAAATLVRQQRSDQALAEERRQFAMLATVGAATLLVQADGTIMQQSSEVGILLGQRNTSLSLVSGSKACQPFVDLFSATELPRVKRWLEMALVSAHSHAIAEEVLPEVELRNGVRVRLQALFSNADGAAGALLQPLAEVNGKRNTDDGLAEIHNVIEWLEEGVVLLGPKQEIRALNSRLGQIIGLAPQEFAAIKTLDDLIVTLGLRTADPSDFAQNWRASDRGAEGVLREELFLVRPVPRLLERAAHPIHDKHGTLLGHVEIYRDLTAQRVFQSKLLQTEKLAELGQMVTGVAHELSNPLTSILGYAQRLLLRRDSFGGSPEARQIFQEAERASVILRQLLLSARETRPERRRVALNRVVASTLDLQRFSSASENIHLELDLDPALPLVLGDPGQLQQVLMNLISNSRHAIEARGKGGTIRVKTKSIAEDRVLLEVEDDGPGIPQAIQARIFDAFFTTKPVGIGTGLGLTIVHGIVREHGGKLVMTSKPPQNTVFSIEFPVAPSADTPALANILANPTRGNKERPQDLPAPEPVEIVHAGAALTAWAGSRVLVLEDEPTLARLIADVLEDEDLCVDVLLDAREALERAGRVNYAMAICDMKMPEVDGEQFYLALARAGNPLRERFLLVTGDVLAARTRDFLERYGLPYVAKPFRVEELTEKIRGVLAGILPSEPPRAVVSKKRAARK